MIETVPHRSTISKSLAWLENQLRRFPPLAKTLAAEPEQRSRSQTRRDITIGLLWGLLCHTLFAIAVMAMIVAMWFSMSRSFGSLAQPWGSIANLALIAQFPLIHSLLLTDRGRRLLARLGPAEKGRTLATTTYAIIASTQLSLLFILWTPSGIIWWRAEGYSLLIMSTLYMASWLLLIKASWDAGAEVQSGLLGWASLIRGVKPQFPPMPETGLFRLIRQPIYLAFALTTWTVPVWTPDQLLLALSLTLYCALAPLAKERRFERLYGEKWDAYRKNTPYWIPLRMQK